MRWLMEREPKKKKKVNHHSKSIYNVKIPIICSVHSFKEGGELLAVLSLLAEAHHIDSDVVLLQLLRKIKQLLSRRLAETTQSVSG